MMCVVISLLISSYYPPSVVDHTDLILDISLIDDACGYYILDFIKTNRKPPAVIDLIRLML